MKSPLQMRTTRQLRVIVTIRKQSNPLADDTSSLCLRLARSSQQLLLFARHGRSISTDSSQQCGVRTSVLLCCFERGYKEKRWQRQFYDTANGRTAFPPHSRVWKTAHDTQVELFSPGCKPEEARLLRRLDRKINLP